MKINNTNGSRALVLIYYFIKMQMLNLAHDAIEKRKRHRVSLRQMATEMMVTPPRICHIEKAIYADKNVKNETINKYINALTNIINKR
jgi:hypothetical protein